MSARASFLQFREGSPGGDKVAPGHDPFGVATGALVVEIQSSDDERWEKLPFRAQRVDEVIVVSPERRSVTWLRLEGRSTPARRPAVYLARSRPP